MGDLLLGVRDAQRLGPVRAASEGRITNAKGAELTGLSLRQFKRLKRRYRRAGAAGLLHGNRGRPSPQRLPAAVREQIESLLRHPEARFNDCHLRDVLAERGVAVSAESVRQVRRALGLPAKRRRRPPRHHRRRVRAARVDSMVLIDGSEYAWLGPHVPPFTLVGTLDDAVGQPLTLVRRADEDLHGYVQNLRDLVTAFGVPETLYGDRTAIAVRNDRYWTLDEELAGRQEPTQFGHMLAELGIHYIAANSPQAKGRIERHWQMLQDRLPAELALRGITTLDGFDAFLPHFLARCRTWFVREPRERIPAWRAAPRHLERILACRYARVVSQDNVVCLDGRALHIPPGPHRRSYARARVEVRELLDGRILVLHQGRVLLEQPAPRGPFTLGPRRSSGRKRSMHRAPGGLAASQVPKSSKPPQSPAGDRVLLARAKARRAGRRWSRRPFKPPSPAAAAAGQGG